MAAPAIPILAVDDDPKVCFVLEQGLSTDNYQVHTALDGESALDIIKEEKPVVVLLDINMPGMDGFEVLAKIKQDAPQTAVLILSGHTEAQNIVQAMRQGAEDFISKPFDIDIVKHTLKSLLEKQALKDQVTRLQKELEKDSAQDTFVGESPAMRRVWEQLELVGSTDLTVLIRGESGTGKDVCSRLIHQTGNRADHPFIKVNCAALPEALLESELFGHERGAFTGAQRSKPGRFELARNGAVFLDEIGEMPIALQPKLLQAIEHKQFVRVGGTKTLEVDVRFIAATNQNIEQQIANREFREDLFFRLNEFTINLPPLRERREDIPLLVNHFIRKYNSKYQRDRQGVSQPSLQLMLDYDWPGNIRELESLIKRVLVLDNESIIEQTITPALANGTVAGTNMAQLRGTIQPQPGTASSTAGTYAPQTNGATATATATDVDADVYNENGEIRPLKATVDEVIARTEKHAILRALDKTRWNRKKAARLLKISYSSLLRRIEKYDLEVEDEEE